MSATHSERRWIASGPCRLTSMPHIVPVVVSSTHPFRLLFGQTDGEARPGLRPCQGSA